MKYVAEQGFFPTGAGTETEGQKKSVMAPECGQLIIEILKEDLTAPRKQRHAAQRIVERLRRGKGCTGSCRTVAGYVADAGKRIVPRGGFAEMCWAPATAQVYFGHGEALDATGATVKLLVLVVGLPYSNARYCRPLYGRTAECLTLGFHTIYDHVGFVPSVQVFGNATSAGRRIGDRIRESEVFTRFRIRHGFEAGYCNLYSGK
ncbi:hypothetical protein ACFSSC_09945 [Corynebacterium mendelii]|uniref:Transposase n=1 Tax=Corynebacterium mendelii TaxID=2765362 RepID=A0A939E0N6_9CORY|nr:hypothetical protein [Corynebacterium mendelii]MBN9644280.1 hypothetical protein [Corynebacterium mendelii]